MRWKLFFCLLLLSGCGLPLAAARAAVDTAGQEAAGIVAGIRQEVMPKIAINPKSRRLELRDEQGALLEEISPGTTGKVVDFSGQEYRLSFGRDELGRSSVLVRPGPAMKQPVSLVLLGRKAVLSPEASLVATVDEENLVYFEPSISGQVYYVEPDFNLGGEVSRRAYAMRESAVLAKPTAPSVDRPGTVDPATQYKKDMESAGESVKSALLTLLGLPDRQQVPKARVYKLKSGPDVPGDPNAQIPSATAGRP